MKKFFLLIILIFLSFKILFSQELRIGSETGFGKYSMSDLKDLNTALIASLPFKSKTVDDFPPFLYYEPKFIFKVGRAGAGLIYSFQSTGSRVSTKDYSGEYRFDIRIKSNSPGIYLEYNLLMESKNELSIYTTFKRNYSILRINEYFNVLDSLLSDDAAKFRAKNYSVEPGITFNRSFGYFTFGINAGYSVNFGKEYFSMIDNKNNYLMNPSTGEPVKPDWRGLRVGLSVYINLNEIH